MIREVADTTKVPNSGPAALMVLVALASCHPKDVVLYEDQVMDAICSLPAGGDAGIGVLVALSSINEVSAAMFCYVTGHHDAIMYPISELCLEIHQFLIHSSE
jgi:hypothetical protein